MSYKGRKKGSYGQSRKRGKVVGFRTNKKKEPYPITQGSGNYAPKLIKPSNKKLNVAPKGTQNEDKPNEENALKISCETEWTVDLLRKDPKITKKEKKKITPQPLTYNEENEKAGSLGIGNSLVNVSGSVKTSNKREIQFKDENIEKPKKLPNSMRYV